MTKSMVIVESPAKARTIERYLGKDFQVRACAGHIKDLPPSSLGVDVEQDFSPTYRIISGKEKIVRELKKEARNLGDIYLAADPDREGEAICQHLAEELDISKDRKIHRIIFNEVTKSGILNAFREPLSIDHNKVKAQQARRILDRLVGYKVSPLLWNKVRRGLSAGRVQTVALRMIVEREKEIKGFISEEYWNFTVRLKTKDPPAFDVKAVKYNGKKFRISNKTDADQLLEVLHRVDFLVTNLERRERKRNPKPPFITSKLQQEASRKLRFSVKKTMMLAQRLYEGLDVGQEGSVGLITYMRTDSVRVSDGSVGELRDYVQEKFGEEYLPPKAVIYRTKKNTQDAHEAIRPTSVLRTPDQVKSYLGKDEYRLYELIWNRFVASQMNPARFDQTEIKIQAGPVEFKTVGTVMKFDGFLRVYREAQHADEGRIILPEVNKGERLQVEKIIPEQKFTQPPPRYNEASLVKALEDKGIGRPSTYAQILSVIMDRDYVQKDEGAFVPTEIGGVVIELLIPHFVEIFDYDYTAKLERDLDGIENGQEDWIRTLKGFYTGFSRELRQAKTKMKNLKVEELSTDIKCEKCGGDIIIRWGRFGKFMACNNYPKCKNTLELPQESSGKDADASVSERKTCEQCGQPMVVRRGRYGEFLACSGYPECKNTMKTQPESQGTHPETLLVEKCPQCDSQLIQRHGRYGQFIACSNYPDCKYIKRETTDVTCPQCNKGELVKRRSRRGKPFYGCSNYPDCKYLLWRKPIKISCPSCDFSLLLEHSNKKEGLVHSCPNPECDYKKVMEPAAAN